MNTITVTLFRPLRQKELDLLDRISTERLEEFKPHSAGAIEVVDAFR
jgi:hypothetical protein